MISDVRWCNVFILRAGDFFAQKTLIEKLIFLGDLNGSELDLELICLCWHKWDVFCNILEIYGFDEMEILDWWNSFSNFMFYWNYFHIQPGYFINCQLHLKLFNSQNLSIVGNRFLKIQEWFRKWIPMWKILIKISQIIGSFLEFLWIV